MNIDFANEILDFIAENPDRHDQASWVDNPHDLCNTTMCIAGTAVFLADGAEGIMYHAQHGLWTEHACTLLDISLSEGDHLFYTNNEKAVAALQAIADDDHEGFRSIIGLPSDLYDYEY